MTWFCSFRRKYSHPGAQDDGKAGLSEKYILNISKYNSVARKFRRRVTWGFDVYACMQDQRHAPPGKLDALRLLLRHSILGQKQNRIQQVHGSWSIVSNFWLSMYAFTKPADFELLREKALRLAEQQAVTSLEGELVNSRVPEIAIYLWQGT